MVELVPALRADPQVIAELHGSAAEVREVTRALLPVMKRAAAATAAGNAVLDGHPMEEVDESWRLVPGAVELHDAVHAIYEMYSTFESSEPDWSKFDVAR